MRMLQRADLSGAEKARSVHSHMSISLCPSAFLLLRAPVVETKEVPGTKAVVVTELGLVKGLVLAMTLYQREKRAILC